MGTVTVTEVRKPVVDTESNFKEFKKAVKLLEDSYSNTMDYTSKQCDKTSYRKLT